MTFLKNFSKGTKLYTQSKKGNLILLEQIVKYL